MTWNPAQYHRFEDERKQPFIDLLSLVEKRPGMRILDLGCGTGELTREIHEVLGARETIGIDASAAMLERARTFENQSIRFGQQTVEEFVDPLPFDLIFSNAALHWVPDHRTLLPRLTAMLSPQGQLAVQVPANDDHPSHRVAARIAAAHGAQPRPDHLLSPEAYATLLASVGSYRRQHVRSQIYGHWLREPRAVVEWVKGALLTHYEEQLGDRYPAFLAEYEQELLKELPDHRPYFYTYRRILFWGS
ncbi:MAG TPA: methyltransferase domain-containing protein, partial [Thermoanaerobaculia bacterium]|nr:methyltransferase domain-containing protein [Thermoanaerobaculia bacterium]